MDYAMTTPEEEQKNPYAPDLTYTRAMGAIKALKTKLPVYDDSYDKQKQSLYNQIAERPAFSYSARDDALYQSYKQSYAEQGKLAMEHTMGAAAGLTGGYGSTYSQSVGGQQYDAYLQKLGEVFPELYGMAYQRYLDEGSALTDQYRMLTDLSDAAYGRYLDQMKAYYGEMDRLQDAADTAYDRGQDAYDRLAEMIVTMGYTPDAEELAAAGMTEKQLQAYLGYYKSNQHTGGGGGAADVTTTKDYKNTLYSALADLAKGKTAEEVNHDILNKVKSGKLDAQTASALMAAVTKEAYG